MITIILLITNLASLVILYYIHLKNKDMNKEVKTYRVERIDRLIQEVEKHDVDMFVYREKMTVDEDGIDAKDYFEFLDLQLERFNKGENANIMTKETMLALRHTDNIRFVRKEKI